MVLAVALAAMFVVFGVFLASLALALMTEQARNRRLMQEMADRVESAIDRTLTDEEIEARDRRRDRIERVNHGILTGDYSYP